MQDFLPFYGLVEEIVAGEEDQLNTKAHPGIPSMGVKVKMCSESIIPELVELSDKGVKLCNEHFGFLFLN